MKIENMKGMLRKRVLLLFCIVSSIIVSWTSYHNPIGMYGVSRMRFFRIVSKQVKKREQRFKDWKEKISKRITDESKRKLDRYLQSRVGKPSNKCCDTVKELRSSAFEQQTDAYRSMKAVSQALQSTLSGCKDKRYNRRLLVSVLRPLVSDNIERRSHSTSHFAKAADTSSLILWNGAWLWLGFYTTIPVLHGLDIVPQFYPWIYRNIELFLFSYDMIGAIVQATQDPFFNKLFMWKHLFHDMKAMQNCPDNHLKDMDTFKKVIHSEFKELRTICITLFGVKVDSYPGISNYEIDTAKKFHNIIQWCPENKTMHGIVECELFLDDVKKAAIMKSSNTPEDIIGIHCDALVIEIFEKTTFLLCRFWASAAVSLFLRVLKFVELYSWSMYGPRFQVLGTRSRENNTIGRVYAQRNIKRMEDFGIPILRLAHLIMLMIVVGYASCMIYADSTGNFG